MNQTSLLKHFKSMDDIINNDQHNYQALPRVETSYSYSRSRYNQYDIMKQSKQQNNQASNHQHDSMNPDNQFNKIYTDRLEKLRPVLADKVAKIWKGTPVNKILHVKPGDEGILVGTLYKEMPLKPNILKQYAENRAILPLPVKKVSSYISDADVLLFEDETGRIKLICDKSMVDGLPTGLNVAIRGKGLPGAEFQVYEIITPGLPSQMFVTNGVHGPDNKDINDDVYVCLASGLNIGDPNCQLSNNLLLDYITGNLGSPSDQKFVSKICRLIIAGNSIHKEPNQDLSTRSRTKQEATAKLQKLAVPIKELDMILSEMCQSLPVDILPGESDPSIQSLPQLPFNACLFPFSAQNINFNPVTNPYESVIGGKIFLGTSGQNIENISKYMNVSSKLELLQNTLEWRHLAPTAPDTLSCAPLEQDPFIIVCCPHVYFMGNGDRFESKYIEGENGEQVCIVVVPKFSETGTVVLVNLRTLEATPVQINPTSFFPHSPNLN
ncbi:DNA polymerase delta subunit 2 [Cavenderia fasciculata]|uniref:DNA polymerase delta subunit 2 n=1 Tax=Cavenderia fasciculata TaxID=261658 RepID=F4PRP8_CACFS|nr:DNA polymerase delta subunit 2 [Cavenderia fasciculata]EGG20547.1 DNA polymerase delta subunit 2 [Cavenderia fasciculata]|eukprot:XP_004358397.1 DNA polymerase delta subunit 2 [Cavenderia fasciculata]